MFSEEFKQRYSSDFIDSFHNFQKGEQFSRFNDYDENVRERFFDYCFDLCNEESADVDKICEFAYQTVSSEREVRRTLFLDFCTKLSDVSQENAITTFKYCKGDISDGFSLNSDSHTPYYFVNFIKKYPQAFLETYTPDLHKNIANLFNLAKIIRTDQQTAPVIINFINNELDQPHPFESKERSLDTRILAETIFKFTKKIVKENRELKDELLPTLNKTAKLKFDHSREYEVIIQRFDDDEPNYMSPVMTNAEFADYMLLLAQNPKMNANAFGLLFKYNTRLENSVPEKTKQNRQILSSILENRIKNHEISAIGCLPLRGFSDSLYKQIIETAGQEISKLKYDSISDIYRQIKYYRPNGISKNVDILNLLKLTNTFLDNVSSPSSWSSDYGQICDILAFDVFEDLDAEPEMSKVVYNILNNLTLLKEDNDFSIKFHKTLKAQAEFGLISVEDLLFLSEKMIENADLDDDYAASILRFYNGVLKKDLSQSDTILSIIENHFCEERIEYYSNAKRILHDIALDLLEAKPDNMTKLLEIYDRSDNFSRDSYETSSFFKMAMPRLEQLNDVPMTKEVAEEIVQLANILLKKRDKSYTAVDGLPLLLNLSERVVQNFPEHGIKILTALGKSYSNFCDKDCEIIDLLVNKIILWPNVNKEQLLLEVLDNSKADDIPWAILAKLAEKYKDPIAYIETLKDKINDPLVSESSGIEILNILIARTADVEPEISKLMPEIIKHSDVIGKKSICELYINLFKASKNNLYLNSLMDFCNKEHYSYFVENGLLQKTIETQPNHEGVRIIMDSVGKLVTDDLSIGYLHANEKVKVFLKNCKEIVDKKLLPAGEVCDRIFNTFDYVSMNSFAELCESCYSIRVADFTTAPRILKGLVKFANDYDRYKDIESVNNILGVFGDVETQTAVNIVLTIDENFDFLKFYTKNTNDLDIFYELNKKMLGKRQYLNFMIKSIMDNDDLTSKDVNNLLITPLRDYARAAAENKEFWRLDNRSVDQYQKYDYLNEPNANLKERSIYGEVGEDISFGDTLNIPVAAINMVEALIPCVGGRSRLRGQEGSLNAVWSELVSCLPQEKQSEIYKQFEGCTNLSYSFVLDMALSSPEQWKKYGKYLADADGHKGLVYNPICRGNSPKAIFSITTTTLEARPETRLKLEPVLRELLGDNITDLYFENIDLMSQLRHRDSSYKRLINAPENKAANFLDAFTEKIKDIAAEPEFAGNRRYNCLSEAMDNNPDKFNQRAQETFEAMLQEKDKYFSAKTNFHDNAYVRNLFPKISNNVDELCEKIGVDDIKECLDYEKRFHKCAIGLYQYNEESRDALSEEDKQIFRSDISTQVVYDMADCGVDNVFWAMNTIKVFKILNERPETYNSSKNEYPVELIVPYSKVNMPDWMYKVVIDNQLPQQRLGSVKNLFDKCNAVKRAPHLASWASEAKQIGKMPLWYQVAAGAITAKLHEGVSEREWKHNLELREIFWKEMKAVQEMGYVKAMQTYIEGGIEYNDDGAPKRDSKNNFIPKNKETRQAISALLENKNIENDKDHYHATINTLAEKGAMNKMFAKEDKSKKLDSQEIIKANKIIAMRDEFKKIKGKKQKLNAIRYKHTQENTATTDHSSVRKPADDKVLAMRKALLKAKQSPKGRL